MGFFGFQSQSGQPHSHFGRDIFVIYFLRFTSGGTPADSQLILNIHVIFRFRFV